MIPFFDARAGIGQFTRPRPYRSADELLARMDACSIRRALVYHAMAREMSPLEGNSLLLEETAGRDRLVPAWVLVPPGSSDTPDYEGYLRSGIASGVRAFAAYPAGYAMPLAHWVRGDAFSLLEKACAPLFVCPNLKMSEPWDRGDWDGMRVLLERHPELPVVFTEYRMRFHFRILLLFLKEFPNLHFDISSCWNYRALEEVVEATGGERLVVGTDLPFAEPGHGLGMVLLADVPAAVKEKIGFRTLTSLIEGVRHG